MRQRGLWFLLLPVALAACTGWRVAGTSPRALDTLPSHLRLTLSDGQRVEVRHARLEGDSLVGQVRGDSLGPPTRRALPVDSIARVAVRCRTAETRSTSFGGGVAVATAVTGFLLLLLTH